MIPLSKIAVFVFLTSVNFLIYNFGNYKNMLIITFANFTILMIIYYLTGFDILSVSLATIFFGTYVFIFQWKYLNNQQKAIEKVKSTIAKIKEEKNTEKNLEYILNTEIEQNELSPLFEFIKLVSKQLLEEKRNFSRMQNLFVLLTNFARYSFSEQDKSNLIKELNNMISYVFPNKDFLVVSAAEIQTDQKIKSLFDEEDFSNLKLGKLEGKEYISFPILQNGDTFAHIILKDKKANEYERLFLYLVSKFSESIIRRIDREKEIELKAITDHLTGIYNRRYFVQHLEQAFAKFKRLGEEEIYSLAIFDIDGFKKINDRYGHYIGDEVLRELAKILKESVRGYDVPARFGGDEFVLFLDRVKKEDAVNVAKRIAKKFSEFSSSKDKIKEDLSISWGLATVNEAPEHFEDIIKLADKRLLKAKASGRGRGMWD